MPSPQERRLAQAIASGPQVDPLAEVTPANFAALEAEIARTTDPRMRSILIDEHNRLKALVPQVLQNYKQRLNARINAPTPLSAEDKQLQAIYGPPPNIQMPQAITNATDWLWRQSMPFWNFLEQDYRRTRGPAITPEEKASDAQWNDRMDAYNKYNQVSQQLDAMRQQEVDRQNRVSINNYGDMWHGH